MYLQQVKRLLDQFEIDHGRIDQQLKPHRVYSDHERVVVKVQSWHHVAERYVQDLLDLTAAGIPAERLLIPKSVKIDDLVSAVVVGYERSIFEEERCSAERQHDGPQRDRALATYEEHALDYAEEAGRLLRRFHDALVFVPDSSERTSVVPVVYHPDDFFRRNFVITEGGPLFVDWDMVEYLPRDQAVLRGLQDFTDDHPRVLGGRQLNAEMRTAAWGDFLRGYDKDSAYSRSGWFKSLEERGDRIT